MRPTSSTITKKARLVESAVRKAHQAAKKANQAAAALKDYSRQIGTLVGAAVVLLEQADQVPEPAAGQGAAGQKGPATAEAMGSTHEGDRPAVRSAADCGHVGDAAGQSGAPAGT